MTTCINRKLLYAEHAFLSFLVTSIFS
uniref:Uncharacterized protein n=1 Tax=Rhizophora mucronata TaxID=61149 RepID=A0A2P2PMN8_RHIMU